MPIENIAIANRGEIAIRIARAARLNGLRATAIYSEDDAGAPHVLDADAAVPLGAAGPGAYLDVTRVLDAARAAGCDALHPGYGFLSENAAFATACAAAGLTFIGPSPKTLEQFGDKARARAFAQACGVAILRGSPSAATLEEAEALLDSLGEGAAVAVKAVAGGGGRGIRFASSPEQLREAFARCRAEAAAAFGSDAIYVEEYVAAARHVEVQIIGDGEAVAHVWDRDCTLQRRNQKLIEIAPAPDLPESLRRAMRDAALRMAQAAHLRGLATFEFLVRPAVKKAPPRFAFIEANARLQVEHTITEEITGLDLVSTQIKLAEGAALAELGLDQERIPPPRGVAVQIRINGETIDARGGVRSNGAPLTRFDPPSGPGVRIDAAVQIGAAPNPAFDTLLAKLIVHAPDYASALRRASLSLREFAIEGADHNIGFAHALIEQLESGATVTTRYVEENLADLAAAAAAFRGPPPRAGAAPAAAPAYAPPAGLVAVTAPMAGKVVALSVAAGDLAAAGAPLAVIEAMKMEHVVTAVEAGRVQEVLARADDIVSAGAPLALLSPEAAGGAALAAEEAPDPDHIRPDLAEALARHALTHDESRPDAVARRHAAGKRTARENVADLCDPDSFVEYGALMLAAQRSRRSVEDLMRATPADGMIAGVGAVNGALFPPEKARCAVMAYDFTVLAGTQGFMNHRKKDRLLHLASEHALPIVIFTEGGGGRPGDTDIVAPTWLDTPTFREFARLSGVAPRIAINAGYCFAGNAALVGCSDVVIATRESSIGMGGPAMIEGGGLGAVAPEAVGPISVQAPNGVVDIVVADEAEGVRAAKTYLSYFQGAVGDWTCADQRILRSLVPENRMRVYDVRRVIETLCDTGSVLELRRAFAAGMVTALVRIEGSPFGLIANNPSHLAGAIDADAADKAARFMQLCDAFGLPLISLCDTPGFMVGPEAEKTSLVRKVSRMFIVGANLRTPIFTVVLRKGYGLGAQAMTGGHFHAPFAMASWPTGEFGPMGLEGAVRLGFKRELDAAPDEAARAALYARLVAESYERGKAVNVASYLEIDDVIDPAQTRAWISRGRLTAGDRATSGRRTYVDAW